MKTVELPEPKTDGDVSVEMALQQRRSIREYRPDPLTLGEVGQLLWAAQGVTDTADGLRTTPSAGALYPLEVYLVAGNVEALSDGVYRYEPRRHRLGKIGDGDRRGELARAALDQSCVSDAPAVLVFSAVYQRTKAKYGERGVRFADMEAGHAAQNVYLQAVSLRLGGVVVGALDSAKVQKLLGLEEEPLYLMPIGRPVR